MTAFFCQFYLQYLAQCLAPRRCWINISLSEQTFPLHVLQRAHSLQIFHWGLLSETCHSHRAVCFLPLHRHVWQPKGDIQVLWVRLAYKWLSLRRKDMQDNEYGSESLPAMGLYLLLATCSFGSSSRQISHGFFLAGALALPHCPILWLWWFDCLTWPHHSPNTPLLLCAVFPSPGSVPSPLNLLPPTAQHDGMTRSTVFAFGNIAHRVRKDMPGFKYPNCISLLWGLGNFVFSRVFPNPSHGAPGRLFGVRQRLWIALVLLYSYSPLDFGWPPSVLSFSSKLEHRNLRKRDC